MASSPTAEESESGLQPRSPPPFPASASAASWILDPAPPPENRRKAVNPRGDRTSVPCISKEEEEEDDHRYTAEDVAISLREGVDVSEHIQSLESSPPNPNLARATLFPRIETTLLETVQDHSESNADDVDDIDANGDGDVDSETAEASSTPALDSSQSEATREIPRGSKKPSHFASPGRLTLRALSQQPSPTRRTARTGADLYYDNAAKMLPSRRASIDELEWNASTDASASASASAKGQLYDIELGPEAEGERTDAVNKFSTHASDAGRRFSFRSQFSRLKTRTKADVDYFREFVEPHKLGFLESFRKIATHVMLPSLILAVLFFYGFDNPPNGVALAPCVNIPGTANTAVSESSGNERRTLRSTLVPTEFPTRSQTRTHAPTTVGGASRFPTTSTPTIAPTRRPTYTFSDMKNETLCTREGLSLKEASVSWWLLFLGVRQVATLCGAVVLQLIVVDFLTFRTRWFPGVLGTRLALAVGQSKGWPCVVFFWAILDLVLLFGPRKFARNWLYFQGSIDLFNSNNPSGDVPNNMYYKRIVYFAMVLSVAATIKRTMMANFVGRRVVAYYMQDLSALMKNLLLVGEIAELSNKAPVEQKTPLPKSVFLKRNSVGRMVVNELGERAAVATNGEPSARDEEKSPPGFPGRMTAKNPTSAFLESGGSVQRSNTFMNAIFENLDEWEEPELQEEHQTVSMRDVLHFRRAVDFINSIHPFSPAFGKATTREECAQASQKTYDKLLEKGKKVLRFDTLCQIAQNPDGTHDRQKVLELVRLFRPSRSGVITKLEFVKSVDSVYKQLRLILANINSSSQIDQAYGQITNVGFYFLAVVVWLFLMGVDVLHVFLGIATLIVSFAFMISTASSKYLEGILLILVRKPYDIGDRVCFMDANAPVNDFGPPSGGWMVESVDLYTTTVRLGATREYATFTNGSLANSRIVNLRRSVKPNIYMHLKFTMNVTKEQLDEFRKRIIEFVKDRPREWIKVVSFRCTDVETEKQYLKFVLIVQHRESWQSATTIQTSKGEVYIHAMHLMKELDMHYTAPELPVHFSGGPPRSLVPPPLDGGGVVVRSDIAGDGFFDDPSRGALFKDEEANYFGDAGTQSNTYIIGNRNIDGSYGNRNPSHDTRAAGDVDRSLVRRKGHRNTTGSTEKDLSGNEPLLAHDETKNKNM